ncbi:MAG: hypothetical protein LUD46_14585 [Parabacteroides sp.]|nr:hypothetical protein [Parabacteroides sp.]
MYNLPRRSSETIPLAGNYFEGVYLPQTGRKSCGIFPGQAYLERHTGSVHSLQGVTGHRCQKNK